MTKTKFALSAVVGAVVLYVLIYGTLSLFFPTTCKPIQESWWMTLSRCEIRIPME